MKRKTFPYNLTLNVTQLLMSVIMQSLLLFQVQFLGEEADDGGGPRREFFALLAKEIQSSLFEGKSPRCFLRHDSIGLQVVLYIYV